LKVAPHTPPPPKAMEHKDFPKMFIESTRNSYAVTIILHVQLANAEGFSILEFFQNYKVFSRPLKKGIYVYTKWHFMTIIRITGPSSQGTST